MYYEINPWHIFICLIFFYSQKMKAGKCPTDALSLTNCAIVCPTDFDLRTVR